ncbi:XRE family transcriptional regulator [Streptomyces sp. p1417]|uniref:XRE family transcriptional regulator n=1 Tax=Streptomyces typhae TaxID=2681492 RepID=A0A6L6WR13_9ACTN|nr:XRE family transcriptional regulator [Streptomyces typhae]MVO84127.1 XRE family transcriptional regulator [Streptomyces typhae]
METDETPTSETFAQVFVELKNDYGVSDTEVQRRLAAQGLDMSVSAVNTWAHGKRTPRADAIRALAAAFPRYAEERLFAAAGRKAPGPLDPDREGQLLAYFRELTEEQQRTTLIQARALRDSNHKS